MERLKQRTLAAPTASQVQTVDFRVPGGIDRWAIVVVPKNTAAINRDAPTVEVKLAGLDGTFRPNNPPISGVAEINKQNVFPSREDLIAHVLRVEVTHGAAQQDDETLVALMGVRSPG